MKIECYLSQACMSEEELVRNIRQALSLEGVEADVSFRRVTDDDARHMGIKGSPTVLINGADIAPSDVNGAT
ncbi:hypothetical protein LCGC14_1883850 [marine sediment metagenome]|uniref:Thioredoxin-like fold domain-containing protein n=1 Tax=marine sediment metagenome TaxID=412755 RepID=A0A0F9GPT4_9ZZZZ